MSALVWKVPRRWRCRLRRMSELPAWAGSASAVAVSSLEGPLREPPVPLGLDELVEHWTLLDDDRELVAGKRGATRLGFALLLKFYTHTGRFPRRRGELPAEAIAFVARQVDVPPEELDLYEWTGRTIEYHRAQIRQHLGFRECTVADADKLTAWLAEHVAQAERRADRVREKLLSRCRAERIEPPSPGRIERIVASALRQAEETLAARIAARLPAVVATWLEALVARRPRPQRHPRPRPRRRC